MKAAGKFYAWVEQAGKRCCKGGSFGARDCTHLDLVWCNQKKGWLKSKETCAQLERWRVCVVLTSINKVRELKTEHKQIVAPNNASKASIIVMAANFSTLCYNPI